MSGQSPVERAEAAVIDAMVEHGPDGHIDGYEEITQAALEAALDVDELARVVGVPAGCRQQFDELQLEHFCREHGCYWGAHGCMHAYGIARAVVAHLTKGNENDE